jgi:hypothetical protein
LTKRSTRGGVRTGLYGAIALLTLGLGPLGVRAPAVSGQEASLIRHVVIIDEENHSFNDTLGRFCVEQRRGLVVRAGLNMPCVGTSWARLADGSRFHLRREPDYGFGVAHFVTDQQTAMDGGKMDGFSLIRGCTATASGAFSIPYGCLRQFDPLHGTCGTDGTDNCIPNVTAYAKQYAISDHTFEFRATPSWAGHMVLADATAQRFFGDNPKTTPLGTTPSYGWGCDSGKVTPWVEASAATVQVPACVPDLTGSMGSVWDGTSFAHGPHASYVPTIFDRLAAAGLPWRIYGGSGKPGTAIGPSGYGWTICPTFWECLGSSQRNNFVPNDQIFTDALNGQLPAVSWVTPTADESAHPLNSMSAGDTWVGRVVQSVMDDVADWPSTAIFITYDDCGCFFDPVNPLQYSPDWGVRVPLVIVSPWAKAGYTDHTPATFASLLGFVEHTFGLPPLNPCATVDSWDTNCTDDLRGPDEQSMYAYADSFDFSQAPLPPMRHVETTVPARERAWLEAHPDIGDEAT